MIDFIKDITVQASKIFSGSTVDIVSHKGNQGNFVTEADLAIEKYLKSEIQAKFPDHYILAEESDTPKLPSLNEHIWFIDPLDGTTAANNGYPSFGISVAYMHNHQVLSGAVYDLYHHDLYWAEKSSGAYKNSQKLLLSQRSISGGICATCSPYDYSDYHWAHALSDKLFKFGGKIIMNGSAAISCSFVANGNVTLFFEKGLKSWDIAAGSLLVEEAGGLYKNPDGQLDIFNPTTFVCSNHQALEEFKKIYLN